ncbi:general stress protein [Calderihabitans maritimus]|uniref:Uncharacterized protein n=1 Tax=Calderihabitans maritimus TaxID=1246530 RepID=A0A1Z5HNA8_9FIRM|nr:general stress protein [Calderihabitans maritimus]GAW91012.1 hypothetical protein TherJR_1626 [Calderihabitans maritimus]
MSVRRTIVGTFKSLDQARRAIKEICEEGLANNQISLVLKKNYKVDAEYAEEVAGDLFENKLHDFRGILVQADDIELPEVGTVEAGGPLAGALRQGDKTLQEALTYYGVSKDMAAYYQQQVSQGRVLAVIETNNDKVNQTANILDGYGAKDVFKWSKRINKPLR